MVEVEFGPYDPAELVDFIREEVQQSFIETLGDEARQTLGIKLSEGREQKLG